MNQANRMHPHARTWASAPRTALAAALGAALAIGAAGCAIGDEGGEARAASDAPGQVFQRGEFTRELLLTGELEAVKSIAIKSPETSLWQLRITYMAEEGSIVEEGAPILDFDNSSLAAQVRELETQILDARTQIVAKKAELASALKDLEIELAEKEYAHGYAQVEASVDPEVMSRKEYSERQLAYEKAARELEETQERIELTQSKGQAEVDVLEIDRDKLERDLRKARDHLALLSIKAPADGLIVYEKRPQTTLRFQEGDSCWPGQNVMQLPDLTDMQVEFVVSEVDAPLLRVGMPLEITLDAFPGKSLMGEITEIPSMAVRRDEEGKQRIFKVTASLEQTWVGDMKPGMSVRGRLVLDRRENAPMVARSAVQFDGEEYWLLPREGAPPGDLRKIEPVARNARWYVISEEEYARLSGDGSDGEPARASVGGM